MNRPTLEVLPIDISPYANGNLGIDYVHRFDSGRPGPHLLVNALTHGNELCGAHALAYLMEQNIRPDRGVLTISFANVAAYQTFDPSAPAASRFIDEDFNRLWSTDILSSGRRSVELDRARDLRPVVGEADYLLDIHSMQMDGPALMLSGVAEKGRALARAVGVPSFVIADGGHKAGPRMRDFADFASPEHRRTALLVECGQHWRRDSVDTAIETMLRFLTALDVVDSDTLADHLPASAPAEQRVIEVTHVITVESDSFTFVRDFAGLEVVAHAGTTIALDQGRDVVSPYDNCVLIMPARQLQPGHTAVRLGRFVA